KNEDSFIYEQNGQVGFNAYTTYDVTNYQIELPKNRLEIWSKLESDRLMFPIFREFYTEREVIQEERRMRVENRGTGKLREKFLGVAFDEHPYRRPVIGYESNIPFLDPAETEKFFRKFYAPNNLVIGIVGDQDFDETEKLVRKYFAPLKPSKQPEPIRTSEKLGEGEKRLTVKFPSGPSLMMGWHKPSFPHPDNDIFEVIDSILSKGTESRLYKKIVLKEKLALSIDAWSGDPGERYSNLFTVFSQINSDADPAKIEKMVWEEIEKLKNESVTQEEMTRIKNNLIADFLRHLDHNGNIADALTYYELITGDWENLFRSYDRIYTVSPEDIRRVAKKYLRPDNVTVGNLVNSGKQ
ncbi:MAG: insulinase family protein, partial [Leptospira sp.]|nr:insulinase family protein [Leptospira sp.]